MGTAISDVTVRIAKGMEPFEVSVIGLILFACIVMYLKPGFMFDTRGNAKPWGIGCDDKSQAKTLFTMPIVSCMFGILLLYFLLKSRAVQVS